MGAKKGRGLYLYGLDNSKAIEIVIVLGIETSCDETGVALYHRERGLLAHRLFSQVEMHAQYGGVVPELASRDHVEKLLPLIREVLEDAKLSLAQIDAVAYTAGPGLIGALLVGACTGAALAFALDKPAVPVHHLVGHLLSPMLANPELKAPFLTLLVSGGHTMLIDASALDQFEIIGDTLDDAAGEAFDKTAKVLGLAYPGGAKLAALATSGKPLPRPFPRPMVDRPGLDFSFSGLKTFALNTFQQSDQSDQARADIARAFEEAVVDTLRIKVERALAQTGRRTLVIAGGVGANQRLRERIGELAKKTGIHVYFPPLEFCTDNGAMIALAGALQFDSGRGDIGWQIEVRPRWSLEESNLRGSAA